jgi:glycine/D-amino acid oxidase-like deaminating enzyme
MPAVRRLPVDHDSNGWWGILPPPVATRRLDKDIRVRTAIIGGGICGVSTANRLVELCPDDDICLIEAGHIGNGASGRNAGFLQNLHSHGVPKSTDILRRNMQLWQAGLSSLRAKVEKWQIKCDWSEAGRLYAAAGPDGLKHIAEIAATLDILEHDYAWADQNAMSTRIGTRFYARGLQVPGSVLVNPAAMMRGLARNLPANVQVYEETAVTGYERTAAGFRITTSNGTVIADRLVLAAGVFLQHFGIATGRFVPMALYASLTNPLSPAKLAELGAGQEFGLLASSENGATVRLTRDKRLFIRNWFNFNPGATASSQKVNSIAKMHRRALAARWPALADEPFAHSWGGMMAFTRNNGAVFGEYAPGLFAVLTNDVSPMTRGETAGGLLAEHMEGQDSPLLSLQMAMPSGSRLPPRPFLDLGIELKRAHLRLVAGKEF